ncbi:hypothetical protein Q5752_005033 [Cryptotrichosporon argae]
MSLLFRRTLASIAPTPGPSSARTLPTAVRRRREQAIATPAVAVPEVAGKTPKLLSAPLEDLFQSLRLKGQYAGDEASARRHFLKTHGAYRSRVRGAVVSSPAADGAASAAPTRADFFSAAGAGEADAEAGKAATSVVGQRVYLPNIQIRLMRNHTAPGAAYDPFVATFRIPPSMTKHDLRSYLSAVYGLAVTFIRTDNYVAPVARFAGGQVRKVAGSRKNYKRAVVGLTEPFHYPDDVDEMRAGTYGADRAEEFAQAREKWLNARFYTDEEMNAKKRFTMKMFKGWRWRASTHDNAGNTIRKIMERRDARERAIADAAAEAREASA